MIDTYVANFKEFITIRLNKETVLSNLIEKYQSQSSDIIGFYCKEIIELLALTGKINCSFKPLNDNHFKDLLPIKEFKATKGVIPIYAILSEESLTQMINHKQHIFMTYINIDRKSFTIEDQYLTKPINQYDPIMSKLCCYKGQYSYDNEIMQPPESATLDKKTIMRLIDEDHLKSIPDDIISDFYEGFPSAEISQLKAKLSETFPFLCNKAYKILTRNINHFIYAKIIVNVVFCDLIHEVFTFQDFEKLTTVFKRLTKFDLDKISSQSTTNEQYRCFIELVSKTEKGLSYDDLIDVMVNRINKNITDHEFHGLEQFYQMLIAQTDPKN